MGWNILSSDTIQWAADKGILAHATPLGQLRKFNEEANELIEAVHEAAYVRNPSADLLVAVKDALGDVTVVLTILAHQFGWTLEECLQAAYDEIKGRTGRIEGGLFVKDGPSGANQQQ